MTQVRVITTIGPRSIDPEVLKKLKEAGADCYRINLSHSNPKSLKTYIDTFTQLGYEFALDTQGAQLRINGVYSEQNEGIKEIDIEKGQKVNIIKKFEGIENNGNVSIELNHPETFSQMNVGDIVRLDFGGALIEITEYNEDGIKGKAIGKGKVIINRAVDVVGKTLRMETLTEFDKYALKEGIKAGCKEIYASFISSGNDADIVRKKVGKETKIISKIETARGVGNVREIMEFSDEILIDRGDLSREISISSIPRCVLKVLDIAKKENYRVNIATNVLDSMMTSQLPSRAEISDIYNLLRAGSKGIVLAAEVAIGNNPIASTAVVKYLIDLYEQDKNGLSGIAGIKRPGVELIGEELYRWL
tara:strand:+ start:1094 stop:2179 length:1086 start_codon:yes stop_codon:yes gene_type:complete